MPDQKQQNTEPTIINIKQADNIEKKNTINPIKSFINGIRYRIQAFQIGLMDNQSQRRIGKEIYDAAYQAVSRERGPVYAACAVLFDCPYDAHISYHIDSTMKKRLQDPGDATEYYDIREVKDNSWVLSVIACGKDLDCAMAIADACAMSAVLTTPTSDGQFHRYTIALENYDKNDAKNFIDNSIMPLFEEHDLHSEVIEL